ncbi:MAG: DUF4268 domain-containing protein [Anaerolineales bacterium]|nr:DUF4268 domain-containing protein [Anaerolineales bacterium]
MALQVQQLIEGKGKPVCITRDEPVTKALTLMVNNDYSQLPVTKTDGDIDIPEGMVTYEGILRGIRNFGARLEDLKVKDVMVLAPVFSQDDDLFDILNKLKETNAVLVTGTEGQGLVGIVTSYDSTEYFRDQTEDLMRVEDIETTIKEFIDWAYTEQDGKSRKEELDRAITAISARPNQNGNEAEKKMRGFDELSLGEYISLLVYRKTWGFFEPVFGIPRDSLIELLNKIRGIRNALAHFRGDISKEQRETLKFCADWFSKRMEEFQARLDREDQEQERIAQLFQKLEVVPGTAAVREETGEYVINPSSQGSMTEFSISEAGSGGGRYALLADWLQSQPGRIDHVQLTFNQVEEIIQADLPPSARDRRVWWANDTVGHSHSQLWLDAGWRTTYINLTEGRVTFSRIKEREKAYIAFFSKLLEELRRIADFPVKDVSPDGTSWIVIKTIAQQGGVTSYFTFSFTRDKRFRVELYLDLVDKAQTKAVFDKLFFQKKQIESTVGPIEWERLDNRRASRLALYHEGQISDEKKHPELQKWAAEMMVKFYSALAKPAEEAISEVVLG